MELFFFLIKKIYIFSVFSSDSGSSHLAEFLKTEIMSDLGALLPKNKKSYLNQVNDSLFPFCAFSSITLGPLVHPFLKGLISCWIID